jgi:hypothetical protein
MVRRLRWFEADDPAAPVDWRVAALIMATLFLNFQFWDASPGMFFPFPLHAGLIAAGALAMTALFFVGPVLATHVAMRPLLRVLEDSMGSVPAFGLRVCSILFLVLWISRVMSSGLAWLWFLGRSSIAVGVIAGATLIFLFLTGCQSLRTSAKLALFTNKLGVAILVAALIRVHEGWPAVLKGFGAWSGRSTTGDLGRGLSTVAFYVAPLALLAANFGYRVRGRRQIAVMTLAGFALPLFAALLVAGVIGVATWASPLYRPSMQPTVMMALMSGAAGRTVPAHAMIFAMTLFGSVRFGLRAMTDLVWIPAFGRGFGWVTLACLTGAVAWCAVHRYTADFPGAFEISLVECLTVAGAVVTADVVTGRRAGRARRIDWVGTGALLVGLAAPWWMPRLMDVYVEAWWQPWLLPSYGIAFLACLIGRVVQRRFGRDIERIG